MVVSPSASAPRISARWEIDLSPGARTRPRSGPPGRAVSPASGHRNFRLSDRGFSGEGLAFDSGPHAWQGSRPPSPPAKRSRLGQSRTGRKADLPHLFEQVLRPGPPARPLPEVRQRVRPRRGAAQPPRAAARPRCPRKRSKRCGKPAEAEEDEEGFEDDRRGAGARRGRRRRADRRHRRRGRRRPPPRPPRPTRRWASTSPRTRTSRTPTTTRCRSSRTTRTTSRKTRSTACPKKAARRTDRRGSPPRHRVPDIPSADARSCPPLRWAAGLDRGGSFD